MEDILTMSEEEKTDSRWKDHVDRSLFAMGEKLDNLLNVDLGRREKYDAFIDMMIARERDKNEMRKAITAKLIGGAVWGAIVLLFTLAWKGYTEK